ncbi:MAG: DUF445 family protein [Gemmatimonadales bacterium]|nr:DUF445 family protein [Gemmatimonadales bacterium]NIN50110.1 DUF445 family protein [Gemmatimonadales bacterium]NIP07574.1 DUF445 family protein [Gemmatimonadales bacterium]NIR01730.1 DUF445 family protein [Gemmatimonadales bacterium]NIS65633.1 DUF445 family protein [Gemmatimonadales bacterium]
MIAEPSLLRAAVTIVFGALAGGLTNAVAISMLFHPYEPRGPWRLKLQGAVPKNRARLARTIGRTVGERLLTSDDLARQLSAPGVREAFDRAVQHFVVALLETERRALRDELPPGLVAELERASEGIASTVADHVADFVGTDAFREAVERFLVRTHDELADRPLGDVLTAARRSAIRERVEQWVSDAVASPELARTIRDWLDRQIDRLAADDTPLLERMPPDLVAAVEREMTGYLPVALDRLAAVLGDPDARSRIQQALHDLFQRFIRELLLHERIVARLVVTEKTIARLLDNFEREGVDQLAALLDEPAMRTQAARSINDAVVNFLRRPLSDHFERLGPDRVAGIKDTAATHIVAALRDPTTRGRAIDQLDRALQAAEHRTWGDLLRHLPPDRAAAWLAEAAQTPRLRTWVADGTTTALRAVLNRPIGRPSDWLPDGSVDRLASQLSPVLWEWIQQQVPEVVAHVDVQTMVEHKVLSFSLERIEQIVRATSQRELDLIVRLGYVLGAIVGTLAYAVSLLLP